MEKSSRSRGTSDEGKISRKFNQLEFICSNRIGQSDRCTNISFYLETKLECMHGYVCSDHTFQTTFDSKEETVSFVVTLGDVANRECVVRFAC